MIMNFLFQKLLGAVLYSTQEFVIKGFQLSKLANYSLSVVTLYSR